MDKPKKRAVPRSQNRTKKPARPAKPSKPDKSSPVTPENRRIFLTGFPGFIGKRLVSKMVEHFPAAEIVFLVQDRFLPLAESDVKNLQEIYPKATFQIVEGDITVPDLKLSKNTYSALTKRITDVFHLAAIYDLAVPEYPAWKVNVEGTENMIEFCKKCPGLKKFVYFSTCYVSGKRTGRIYEKELEMGQDFKNYYESTKHEAEVRVRRAMKEIPTMVIRPSIVIGDSLTGETQKFDGPYFAMALLDKLNFGIPFPYLGESQGIINLVPIDYVINATVALWLKPDNAGKTYQMADPKPFCAKEIYRMIHKAVMGREPFGQIPMLLIELPLSLAFVRKLFGLPREVLIYFEHESMHDTTDIQKDLEGTGVFCPSLDSYIDIIVRFYKEHSKRKDFFWKAY